MKRMYGIIVCAVSCTAKNEKQNDFENQWKRNKKTKIE